MFGLPPATGAAVSDCADALRLSPAGTAAADCGAATVPGADGVDGPEGLLVGALGSSVSRMPSGVFLTASRTTEPGVSETCVCTSRIDLPTASRAMLWPSSSSTFASMMSPILSAGTAAPCCGLSATVVGETIRSTVAVLAGGGRQARIRRERKPIVNQPSEVVGLRRDSRALRAQFEHSAGRLHLGKTRGAPRQRELVIAPQLHVPVLVHVRG